MKKHSGEDSTKVEHPGTLRGVKREGEGISERSRTQDKLRKHSLNTSERTPPPPPGGAGVPQAAGDRVMRKGTCYPGRLTGFIKMARDQTQASIMEGKEDGGDALQPGEGTRTGDGRPRKGGVRRCGRPASIWIC